MKQTSVWLVYLVFFLVLLTGCGVQQPDQKTPPVVETPTIDGQASPTFMPTPTETLPIPTDTPQPGMVVLLAPNGSDTGLVSRLFENLQSRFSDLELRWEIRQSLSSGDLTETEIRLVIAFPVDTGTSVSDVLALAAAAPQVQFLALGIPDLQPGPNLSLVGTQGLRPDRQGFIAGVIAAMITPDWRVAILGPGELPSELSARQGFINGAVYFCGLCLPYHGPTNIDYPVYWDLPSSAGLEEVQASVQGLKDLAVTTIYFPYSSIPAEWIAILETSGLQIIGSGAPPPELSKQWVVTVQADPLPSIYDLLPALFEGQGGHSLDLDIALLNINEDLFSPGRQVRALEILADLEAGYIDPGLDIQEP